MYRAVFSLLLLALWAGSHMGYGATIMSFAQTDSSQAIYFQDNGAGSSRLTTLVAGNFDIPIDVNFTFLAPNKSYAVGTTVAAKLTIHATDDGQLYWLGGNTYMQGLNNVSFSFTDVSGSVNFLSGTGGLAYLVQLGIGSAYFEMYHDPGAGDLHLSSDSFLLSPATDETQAMQFNFTTLTPSTFGDTNTNNVLDDLRITTTTGSVRADAAPVPEPGSASLFGLATIYVLRRRRRILRCR